jgi:hypothetical protein
LQDGTALQNYTGQQSDQSWVNSETLVLPQQTPPQQQPARVQVDIPQQQQSWAQPQPSAPTFQAEPKKSNTMKVVVLTALGMFLLFGIGGIGAWILVSNMRSEIAANTNAKGGNANSGANANANANQSANTDANSNANANVNANANTTNVNANIATPKPTLKPEEIQAVRDEVNVVIDDWKDASERLDLESHLSNYADTVDYYKGGKVNKSKVASDKQKAYEKYNSIVVTVSNVKVTPGENADEATATFDKEWSFAGDEEFSSGKVQQQLKFKKISGKWKIAGEKDLKVYFVEK